VLKKFATKYSVLKESPDNENLGFCFYEEHTNKTKNPTNSYHYDPQEDVFTIKRMFLTKKDDIYYLYANNRKFNEFFGHWFNPPRRAEAMQSFKKLFPNMDDWSGCFRCEHLNENKNGEHICRVFDKVIDEDESINCPELEVSLSD